MVCDLANGDKVANQPSLRGGMLLSWQVFPGNPSLFTSERERQQIPGCSRKTQLVISGFEGGRRATTQRMWTGVFSKKGGEMGSPLEKVP